MATASLWQELRRRRVGRVALLYIGAAFITLQGADLVFPALLLPEWTFRLLVAIAILGLPVVLAVVWGTAATPAESAHAPLAAVEPERVAGSPAAPGTAGRSATPWAASVAVLPFINMSADPENEFFSDGMTEELLNVLTKLGRFRVPARTSCFAFKGKDLDVREIGRQLGVDVVVEGSVRKAGDRVRITSQLVNVEDGYHIWSETFDRKLEDIFAIQDEIALRIVEGLDVRLTPREVETIRKAPTSSVRAYEYYLKGRQAMHTRRSWPRARELFEQAIDVDPDYALAYAGVADCCSFLYMYSEHTEANLQRAQEASRIALEHDPMLAEAHASHGLALSLARRYDEAEAEFERAIRLDPSLFEAYYFHARACFAQGKHEKAAEMFLAAHRVRPEDYQSLALLTTVYGAQGLHDEPLEAARRTIEIARAHLGLYPDDARARYLGALALILIGQRDEGRAWLEQALQTDEPSVYYNVACGFVHLGEHERALDCLERAVAGGWSHREWLERDADLLPLREYPRFHEILRRMPSGASQVRP